TTFSVGCRMPMVARAGSLTQTLRTNLTPPTISRIIRAAGTLIPTTPTQEDELNTTAEDVAGGCGQAPTTPTASATTHKATYRSWGRQLQIGLLLAAILLP